MRIQAGSVLRNTVLRRLLPGKVRYPSPWVLAISGGIDSMVLLHLLVSAMDELGNPNLIVAAFDHRLRLNSALDRDFVEQVSAEMGLPFVGGRANRQPGGASGANIEAFAREQRYDFLAGVARQHHARVILTAHHADDQVETILLHLLRGTGLSGLRGMSVESPVPGNADLLLVRPLLEIFRKEIERYAVQHGLSWREDETNTDESYSRNRLRRTVLPLLRSINPSVDQAILRASQVVGLEDDFVHSVYQAKVGPCIVETPQRVTIDLNVFRSLHDALQRRFLHDALVRLRASEPQFRHIQAAQHIARTGTHGMQSLFAGGFRLRIEYERLHVEAASAPLNEQVAVLEPDVVLTGLVPGRITLGKYYCVVFSREAFDGAVLLGSYTTDQVIIRTRRPGDRFQPHSLKGHSQSLKKWFIDHKIPQYQRATVPVIVIEDRIAGIVLNGKIVPAYAGAPDSLSELVYASVQLI